MDFDFNKLVTRRDILKSGVLVPVSFLLAQTKSWRETLNELYKSATTFKSLEESTKKAYEDLDSKMKMFFNPKIKNKNRYPLTKQYFTVNVGSDEVGVNIEYEYWCGPRGGGGEGRLLIYLDEKDWHTSKGIDTLDIRLLSRDKSRTSLRIFEVNPDCQSGVANYDPLEYVRLEGDLIFERVKGAGYALLKKIEIKKKDIKEILALAKIITDIYDIQTERKIRSIEAEIVGDHAYHNRIGYNGCDKFESGWLKRSPKAVALEIKEGEKSFAGIGIRAKIRGYYKKGIFGEVEVRKEGFDSHFFPTPMDKLFEHYGIPKYKKKEQIIEKP